MTALAIDIRGKAFGDRSVLRDVVFDAAEGEIVAVMGASGCGKSTLLSLIAGIDRAYEGTIARPVASALGIVFQEPRLLPWLTARANVELVVERRRNAPALAMRWLRRVGLGDAADVHPRTLSLGMARRVAMARALAVDPTVLLLDEPFSSLDEVTADQLRALLFAEARARRITTIVATHDIRDVVAIADRLIALQGSPATVTANVPITMSDAARRDRAALSLWTDRLRRRLALAQPAAARREA
ncbi:MAG: ABC transporter ATP-binding protein [Gemmatimonas sp.]